MTDCNTAGCPLSDAIADHEQRIRDTEKALASGDTRFIKIEGQLSNVNEKLGELNDTIKSAIRWLLGIVGTTAAGGVIWSIVQSGGKGLS